MEDSPIVTVEQGQLQGKVESNPDGRSYYSFQGIPYAKPPLGSLRFKAPEPAEPWEGVRDATTEGNICAQINIIQSPDFVGDENCLFLNVYTPTLDGEFLPVMVYIHGGAYRLGSGNAAALGPDYIVEKDIVVVTINYRVGPLGFLCLNTPEVPGNAGLKDAVAALRWVENNIGKFGGNSGNLTVFGESAGAAVTSVLTVSPLTKHMISKAIMMSGNSLNDWAFQSNPLDVAKALATHLGCDSNDIDVILDFLRATSAKDLIEATEKLYPLLEMFGKNSNSKGFSAVVEKEFPGVEAIVTEPFADYLTTGRVADIPVMIGTTEIEFAKEPDTDDFRELIPKEFNLAKDSDEAVAVAEKIKRFYFQNGHVSVENWSQYFLLLSDVAIVHGVHRYVKYVSSVLTKPIYVYRFDYDGGLNLANKLQKSFGLNHAGHFDVRPYLFRHSVHDGLELSPQDLKTRERIVRLFTNFAKTGNPTPDENHYINVTWLPVTKDNYYYLLISNELSLKTDPDKERMEFWDSLYNKYYKIWEQPRSNNDVVPLKAEEEKPVEVVAEEPKFDEEANVESNTIEATEAVEETKNVEIETVEPVVEEEPEVKTNGHAKLQENGDVTKPEIKIAANGGPKDVIRANDPPEDDLPKNIGVNKFVNFFESLGGKKK